MVKTIASAILITIFTGLAATLWAFHGEIVSNSVEIKNIKSRNEHSRNDVQYIRSRVDKIHELLLEYKIQKK